MQDSVLKGISFPYQAVRPSVAKKSEFRSITDVYDEILILNDMLINKKKQIGLNLYKYIMYFADPVLLVKREFQNLIQEYRYCSKFNSAPYESSRKTPKNIIDNFLIIDQEYNSCINEQNLEVKKDA